MVEIVSDMNNVKPLRAAELLPAAVPETRAAPAESAAEKTETGPEEKAPGLQSRPDVSLVFKVNEETQDLTVYILDRASRQVLRTVPSDEISNLKPGDLLELFA